jgi:hypothetical protein
MPHRRHRLSALVQTALCALFVLLPSPSPSQQTEVATSNEISGTVINSLTREPMGRTLVCTADQGAAAFTDDHGHFELRLSELQQTPEGRQVSSPVVLEARRPGFFSSSGPHGQILATRGQKDVTISLIPEALIVGRVKFPSAETADRVQVSLYRREIHEGQAQWMPVPAVTTRSDGEFRFADLRPGEYKVFTNEAMEQDPLTTVPNGPAFGFPPRFFAAAPEFASADVIQLRAGERRLRSTLLPNASDTTKSGYR